ncbi:MAG: hypothetical protein K5745_06160 [Saccharofermentans sp.]|nr:hypothetical protein [Saccharofermentans sp.]
MSTFSPEYNLTGDAKRKAGTGYVVAAVICSLAILAMVIVMVVVNNINSYRNLTIPEFEQAIDEGDYEGALAIYRSIQDEVLSASPEEAAEMTEETELLNQMEQIVKDRADSICTRILEQRYVPIPSDVEFLDQMKELTSSVVSDWLNNLCVDFLLGKEEKPDVIFAFDQLSPISNFAATTNPLLREIDVIETATGQVQEAEADYSAGDYIGAVQTYQEVSGNCEGFVYDYAIKRIDEIKNVMYEPMMEEGEHMLETFRFYSAEQLLSDLAVIFPEDERIRSDLLEATGHTTATGTYYGPVEVLCVRALIANEETAFADSYVNNESGLYLTGPEFQAILEQLYQEGYCLVNAEDLIDMSDPGFLLERNLVIPEGKKPLIIVIENLCYSATAYDCGICRRLVLNDKGEVCGEYAVTNERGDEELVISRTAESIGILDTFIEQHPDFTYDGARGIISVSGFENCFGYIVSEDEIDDHNQALATQNIQPVDPTAEEIASNCETVRAIANVLKDNGWQFASCTYGYITDARSCDMDTIQQDTQKWLEQIGALLGETHMIVYPGGNYIYGTDDRAVYLKNLGFRIFFGIGSRPYYTYGDNYLYFDRAIISGNTLKNIDYSRIIDASSILDTDRHFE